MITIYNNVIPVKGYKALTTYSIIWVRGKNKISEITRNHEKIHMIQQYEVLVLSGIIGISLVFSVDLHWGYVFISPLVYFILYTLNFLVNCLFKGEESPYRRICFEREAYKNQGNMEYCKRRFFKFSFLKYL